ncbi:MAG: TIGR02171 family protein [Fibrobacter sp.]|nr:TIGR02171 family protein [Fibrobacter sp.]
MKKGCLAFLLFCYLAACSDSSPSFVDSAPCSSSKKVDGMILVHGGAVTLGSNDSSYRVNERPAMNVLLDYDFYMDVHEVTCDDYQNTSKNGNLKDFGECENGQYPLSNVTYYDAVLFANAKSKLENYDTAYTYSKAVFDSDGHCTNLDGFAFHPEVNAYRLPTESEWVYAASRGWDPSRNSWNADNADFKVHQVCTVEKDSLGFCDLAGNVKEWVNDWAGKLRDTTIVNFVGSAGDGNIGERILKGGYYSDRASNMNVVSRGDDYTVVSSSRAKHIGFRLALGAIPSPTWLSVGGNARSSIVSPIASASALKRYTGTNDMMLAFRNDLSGNLAYINYKDVILTVTEISDSIEVYHPDISPDGRKVAFCTKFEGLGGNSRLYVRDLNEMGTNLVKLDVASAAIPRWRVLENGDTVIVYVTDAGDNKDDASFKRTSTWQVKFADGKFGNSEKLFDGAYHGGISEDYSLAVCGARLLRARIAKSGSTVLDESLDTVWYNGEQACNASLAQDGSKRVAFLDFGGTTGRTFASENYSTHQRLLIADSTGKLIKSVKATSGYTFDHSEWVSGSENSNIVATLANANGAHTKIVLANLADESIVELAEGEELWHPTLWVKRKAKTFGNDSGDVQVGSSSSTEENFVLNLDSAGVYYNNSGACPRAAIFRYKMELLWHYKDYAKTVILGSSRAYHGVNPRLFDEKMNVINMAVPAATIYGNMSFFENYILPHMKNIKLVITSIDIDRGYLTGQDSENIFYKTYKSYPGYVYDENHNFWKDGYPEGLFQATYESPGGDSLLEQKMREDLGYYSLFGSSWATTYIRVREDSCWMDKKSDIYRMNFGLLERLLQICKENDIFVIGVLFPQDPKYKNTGAYGYTGLRRSEAPALIQEISDLSKVYSNFILVDENKMGNHDYTDIMGYDNSHISDYGAQQLTHRLDSLVHTLDIEF